MLSRSKFDWAYLELDEKMDAEEVLPDIVRCPENNFESGKKLFSKPGMCV